MISGPSPESRTPNPGTSPLLIEIGCEEIPARFLAGAQKDLGERLQEALTDAALLVGAVREQPLQTYSTPRRLVAHVPEILGKQGDKIEEVRGPAVKAAFDAQGKPTRAAESFAAKNGATVRDLIKVSTPKGEYVAVQRRIPGRPALEVLPEILPSVVTGLSFPKSMYWEKSKTRFIRPIRWILALFGEGESARVVPFEIAGVESGNQTYGHRMLGPGPVGVCGFADYAVRLRDAGVEFDPKVRRELLARASLALQEMAQTEAIKELAGVSSKPLRQSDPDRRLEEWREQVKALPEGLKVVEDRDLEEWVVNSTECPRALMGTFEERFLELPREILVTVMRDHQKYFAVEDEAGRLQPKFVASLNLDSDPKGLIRAGHERVLAARFADAEFFWNADQRILLRDRLPMLERVTYQAKLGSYADKVRRMEVIARRLCADLEGQGKLSPDQAQYALRAVRLCKCDLTTQMVQEFTELQGVVGGLYARVQGEPDAVWQAIYDHYLPLTAEDQLPRFLSGAVASLADKFDSVVAGFSAGLEPTGSSDPFGLRRAGNGIIKVSVELLPGLDLLELLRETTEASLGLPPRADLVGQATGFLRERAESYLENVAGLRYDTVRAVVQSFLGWSHPADALARGKALERIRDSDDFVALSSAAKRTRNILTKSAEPDDLAGSLEPIDKRLLTEGPETELYGAYEGLRPSLDSIAACGEYEDAFRVLAGLRPYVDRFFDKILVMDNNLDVRRNRLNLLSKLNLWVFKRFADLSQIESKTSSFVDASTSKAVASDK